MTHIDRIPPQAVDLEMCVLGGVLLEPVEAYDIAAEYLTPASFYLEGHGLLFRIMGELNARGIPPDMNAVLDELRTRNLLDKVGGSGVVMGMLNSVPTAASVEFHSKKVAEKAALRNLIHECSRVIESAYRQEASPAEIFEDAETRLLMASDVFAGKSVGAVSVGALAEEYLQELSEIDAEWKVSAQVGFYSRGMKTKFPDYDNLTGGIMPDELTLVAARPSVGKTALMLSMAYNLSIEQNYHGMMFSLEMSQRQLIERLLSIASLESSGNGLAGVSIQKMRRFQGMTDEEWSLLSGAYKRISEGVATIYDCGSLTVNELAGMVRRARPRPAYIMVDYLQLMTGRKENRVAEVSEISRGLKNIARQHHIPVIALSQLNREVENRPIPKPQLSDLRDSGSIEQDADTVLFLWREKNALTDWQMPGGGSGFANMPIVQGFLAKNRNGPIGEMEFLFHPEATRFYQHAKS